MLVRMQLIAWGEDNHFIIISIIVVVVVVVGESKK